MIFQIRMIFELKGCKLIPNSFPRLIFESIFMTTIVIFLTKSVIFEPKLVIFETKIVFFERKIVILRKKLVSFQGNFAHPLKRPGGP